MNILAGILIYLMTATMVGIIGRKKVMGFWGFFLISVIFTPLTGFLLLIFFEIIALISTDRRASAKQKTA